MDVRYEMPSRRSTRLSDIAPGDTFIPESREISDDVHIWMRIVVDDEKNIACVNLNTGMYREFHRDFHIIRVKTEAQVVFVREWG